ncbi:ankyrin-3-like [Nasonia vitripennis]|uniref:Uncharacterized protein n=1 Tax=Nasonia vitripennis TaxID=7425 RepID=A0A7M7M769_NASVI|nr:ankyrin-3-like [Nasonia vitripennis]XP_016841054.1 ankyrin-3-like [Nasonia vitripennis]XP_031787004.1 ankyrin-3-like [Nasonia vitripennis]
MLDREFIVFRSFNLMNSDPYDDERVKSFDRLLHRAINAIISESHLTTGQIKQLLRTSKKRTDENSIVQLIVRREPALGHQLLKKCKLSLLWIAVISCYQDSAELLVGYGADVNERYGLDKSPDELLKKSTILHALLQMYPSKWNERLIELVIDHGADVNARDATDCNKAAACGCTALHLAVEYGRVKMAEMLLEKGAEVNAVRGPRLTPMLEITRTKAADELLPLLLKYGANVNASDEVGKNALHHLASAPVEYVNLARAFIEMGVSLDDRTKDGHLQPMHLAVYRGHNKLMNLFFDHGANVNSRMAYGDFPLKLATRCNDPEVLLTLLKRGANIDATDNHGRTALHIACENSNLEKIKMLLSVGADAFVGDRYGQTPFEIVCGQNFIENPSTRPMLKMLALAKACSRQPLAEFINERIIREMFPQHWNYYQLCHANISLLKSRRFIETCTLFELLTSCRCHIAALMQNQEFESRFRMCDLDVFPMYAEDVLEAFERAESYYQHILDFEDLIIEVVNNILPCVVVRKVISYVFSKCEICELKKTVSASRSAP